MLFFDTEQMMLDYAREVRNSYSKKKYSQQLDPHVYHGCDAQKMMQVYAEKVSPTYVPCEDCPSVRVGLVTSLPDGGLSQMILFYFMAVLACSSNSM